MLEMVDDGADHPYKTIGWHLKFAREQLKQSLAEVSGAVEIDESTLSLIESGGQRPSEDILLLLISYLGLDEKEATSLWTLAGYDFSNNSQTNDQIAYTDMVNITVNDYGLVMNFFQASSTSEVMSVAKVGMSKAHAKHLLEALNAAIKAPKIKVVPKYLKAPKAKKSSKR